MKEYMDVLINAPKEIYTTFEEFTHFTYYEIAAFFCNWKVCFYKNEDGSIKMRTSKWSIADTCMKSKRFEGIDWFENESTEVYSCTIPKDNKLIEIIETKFNYLFLK
jgi:hypothetical protein